MIVIAIAVAAGCFGSKKGSRGTNTNVGTGSDNDGPWSGGTTAAMTETP